MEGARPRRLNVRRHQRRDVLKAQMTDEEMALDQVKHYLTAAQEQQQ